MAVERSRRSLLLVEFAVIGRYHRAVEFPRLQGLAKREGFGVRWVRFAVPPDAAARKGEDGAHLEPGDLEGLKGRIAAGETTDLIFSHRPSPSLLKSLAGTIPVSRVAFFVPGVLARRSGGGAAPLGDDASAAAFLGLSPEAGGDGVEADYSWEAGNDAARELEPLPFVRVDAECRYERSLAGNAFFTGLGDEPGARRGGCSFCLRPDERGSRRSVDMYASLERQLRAVDKGYPRGGARLKLRLIGEGVLREIDRVVESVASWRLGPMEFLLDARADALIRAAPRMERALRLMEKTPHRCSLALVGIENFSSVELARYNKGVTPRQNLEAIRLLFDWERRHGARFGFSEHAGLSMITFNPWTRPEDADLNIAVANACGLEPVLGKLWTGRLRLYPGLPLTAKARADRLLASSRGDSRLGAARRNFYEEELAWRFQRPEMEGVNRLLARFEPEGGPGQDPLALRVADFVREAQESGHSKGEAAHCVVLAAQRLAWEGKSCAPARLLARARRLAPRRAKGIAGRDIYLHPRAMTSAAAAALLARKPVLKLEPIDPAEEGAWRALDCLPNPRFRRMDGGDERFPGALELFAGRDPAAVERAVALGRGPLDSSGDIAAMGELLGYPSCCARAFSRVPAHSRSRMFWQHVANRAAEPGRVAWELNPAMKGIEHSPCSLSCRRSLASARAELGGRRPSGWSNPWLLLWGGENDRVELRPRGAVSTRFRYSAGRIEGKSPDLESVRAGDEIELGDETILILRRGRPFASLSGRAFLWWQEAAYQRDFWTALAELRRTAPFQSGQTRPGRSGGDGRVVRLSGPRREIALFVAPLERYRGPAYARTAQLAVCVQGDLSLEPDEIALIDRYVHGLTGIKFAN